MTSGHLGPRLAFAFLLCSVLSCRHGVSELTSPHSGPFATGWLGSCQALGWGKEGLNDGGKG